jgi:hypothetical protein
MRNVSFGWACVISVFGVSACAPMGLVEWRDVRVPEAISSGDEVAVQRIIEADVESFGGLGTREQRAAHVMKELITTELIYMKPRTEVRWNLIAHIVALEYAYAARDLLLARLGLAITGYRTYFRPPAGVDVDEFYEAEVLAIDGVCPRCMNEWATATEEGLITTARGGRVKTLKRVLALVHPSLHGSLCDKTSSRGRGALDVATDPEIVKTLEACGARRHSEEEQESTYQAHRDQQRRERDERIEAERIGAIREQERRRENAERARDDAARDRRASDMRIGEVNAAAAAAAGAETSSYGGGTNDSSGTPSASGAGNDAPSPANLTLTVSIPEPLPPATPPAPIERVPSRPIPKELPRRSTCTGPSCGRAQ